MSKDHAGMYVSNVRDARIDSLVYGVPHCVLLQNTAGELAVMVAANAKPLPMPPNPGTPFAGEMDSISVQF
jgi:hypothetical protein